MSSLHVSLAVERIVALPTRRATIRFAHTLAKHCGVGDVLYLDGPLGAGKTFFVRALLRSLGLAPSIPVTSPTFALLAVYDDLRTPVVHGDLYRLETSQTVRNLDLPALRGEYLLLLEWAHRFVDDVGTGLHLSFTLEPRAICIRAMDARSTSILEALP